MKLYGNPFSCALASNIVLKELDLETDYAWVQLSTKQTTEGEDYFAINPKGKVPALVLGDGTVLSEGVAVMQFLADENPQVGLLPPPGTAARAKATEWLVYLATELHKKIFYPVFNPGAPRDAKSFAMSMLPEELSYIEATLSEQDYIAGDEFTPADAYLVTILNWAGFLKTDLSAYPATTAYQAKVIQRPSVAAAFAQERTLYESHAQLRPDAA
ncbi:MAG: glutathione transferase GstA [Pseudomonadota bacterium]